MQGGHCDWRGSTRPLHPECAGVQTGLAALRPALAAKALGGGYLASLLADAGAFGGPSTAEAQTAKAPTKLPGLSQEQQNLWDATQSKISRGRYKNDEELEQLKMTLQDLRDISKDFSKTQNMARIEGEAKAAGQKQDEYDRAVKASEDAFKHEMSRDRRFSDTVTGQTYDKTGGLASVLAGGIFGAGSRLASGPGESTTASIAKNYVLPAILGGAAGAGAYNAPLAYNTFGTEPDNPKKRAYEARAEALPPDHPRRQEFLDYAKSLPDRNPVQTEAEKAFYEGLGKRSLVGALEGAGGGLFGADMVRAGSRGGGALSGVGSWLSQLVRGPRGQQSSSGQSGSAIGGSLPATGTGSPSATAGAMSSGSTLPVRATEPNAELVRVLAQGQLPAPSVAANSDDLLRALKNPANRNVPKSAEVKRGKDKLGRPFAKDPDDGRFTPDPDK
jgi:hypothetical protein